MGELFEESEVAVFEGDHRVGEFLAQQPFDHIFFTGSPEVGRRVMAAAAANLTSVTLELGGKSPVIVDPSADIDEVATKVLWGKTVNAGQSCVAPDYVLVPKNLEARFIELARDSLEKRFGSLDRLAENPDFGRIINKGHFQRIKHLVDDAIEGGARIEMGGRFREDNRFISPTVLTHVPPAAAVLQEEIFGPVLPIVTYESREDALRFVNERPTPLALYVFGKSKPAVEAILKETGAGGTMVNDVVVHFANPYLPFGGLKESGIGKAHGVSGFKAFSNERPVMHQRKWTLTQLLYPPYTRTVLKLIGLTIRYL